MSIARVLFLDHTAQMGGGEIALFQLIQHLDRTRFAPMVILFSDGPLRERLQRAGVAVDILPLHPAVADARKGSLGCHTLLRLRAILSALSHVWRLRRRIRDSKADIVHANSLKADVLGGIAARLAGVPIVWHVRDRIASDYLPPAVANVFRVMCRVVPSQIITNSAATLATLGRRWTRHAVIVHSGVSIVHDGTLLQENIADRQSTDFSSPTIGLVARLSPWKGQHIFIEAAALVLQKFPDAMFQLIGSALFGEDDYEAALHQQIERLKLCDRVRFLGFRTDVSSLVRNLTLLVHASTIGEPFGQVIIEGMAAGKAVVATDGGGVPEIVLHGVTGLLVPMGDAPAMADAICALLADPARAQAMGRAGLDRVRDRFLAEHTAKRVMNVFDEVLARSRSASRKQRGAEIDARWRAAERI